MVMKLKLCAWYFQYPTIRASLASVNTTVTTRWQQKFLRSMAMMCHFQHLIMKVNNNPLIKSAGDLKKLKERPGGLRELSVAFKLILFGSGVLTALTSN